ncbi:MAG: glycogen debranching enzyme family protein, partial [Chloroflexi bacterium]|nr:glycogen debranching enzyme family protein [Chloroflexota bacterium]
METNPSALPQLRLDRPTLLDFEGSLQREWLVTNGLGGYASSTVLGVDTRRYHGLLMAALHPPVQRTLLLARVHEELELDGDRYPLCTNEYHDGTIHPHGYLFLQVFRLAGTLPTWRFHCRDAELEKTLWMVHRRNTVLLRYRLLAARRPVRLRIEPFAAHRDDHTHTRGHPDWRFGVQTTATGCRVEAYPGATPMWLGASGMHFAATGLWYWRFLHRRERERGLDDLEDLYTPGVFERELRPGQALTLVATTHEEDVNLDPEASHAAELARQSRLIARAELPTGDHVGRRLALAADQFLVARPAADRPAPGRTIVAGYHWFADWGRDTMISLPGLCLAAGRMGEARTILTTFVGYLNQGLLPNRFPDAGEAPEYNTADATLWLFETTARYLRATGDAPLLDELLPSLQEIVAWHQRGTHHGI